MQPDSNDAPKRIMINDVLRAVMQEHRLSKEAIFSRRGSKSLIKSRHIGFYLCRILTRREYGAIGYYFGGLDHSTVMYAFRRIEALKIKDRKLSLEIDKIALSAITIATARERALRRISHAA